LPATQEEISRANAADPTEFLESRGYRVQWEGRHAYVWKGDEKVFRLSLKPDGKFISCAHRGDEKIGDNIALVRAVDSSLSFQEAVAVLLKAGPREIRSSGDPEHREPTWRKAWSRNSQALFFPPEAKSSIEAGRAYLMETRGILPEVLAEAEYRRAVRYAQDYVGFCGYDERGRLRNVSMRSIGRLTPATARTWNMTGSDKSYPTIFLGCVEQVWIVEGGVDGLAVQCLCIKTGLPLPTTIVSGGGLTLSFLDNPAVQALLRKAQTVWLAGEREKDEETQRALDQAHAKQKAKVLKVLADGPGRVRTWMPPEGVKDIADRNFKFEAEEKGVGRRTGLEIRRIRFWPHP
jgi:hypothetical protein